MKKQISLSEVDALIKQTIFEKGLKNHISEEQLEEIKKKVRSKLTMPSAGVFYMNPSVIPGINDANGDFEGGVGLGGDIGVAMEEVVNNVEQDDKVIEVPEVDDSTISHQTIVDDQSINVAKKEGALEQKEQELSQKEQELKFKEQELQYKPSLPSFVEKAEPGQLFVYDMNQLSFGGESLSNVQYNSLQNPENKISMHDLWLNDGKVRAELFKVEYKKMGELIFDPFNGSTKFVEMTQPTPEDLPKEEVEGVKNAIDSQIPKEPMIDSVQPLTNVIMPASTDMGLVGADVQAALMRSVEDILRHYFTRND